MKNQTKPDGEMNCLNCHRPGPPLVRGRCNICYLYHLRTGRERPAEPVERLCDCGQPVSHVVEIKVGSGGTKNRLKREVLELCEDCYEYEREVT
jgi:hypothetical protein